LRRAELELPDADLAQEVTGNLDFYRGALGDERQPLRALGADLHARVAAIASAASEPSADALERRSTVVRPMVDAMLRQITDPDWLPLIVERELANVTAFALDHPSSRLRAKRWLRGVGGQLLLGPAASAANDEGLQVLRRRLHEWSDSAARAGLLDIAALCRVLDDCLAEASVGSVRSFGGELAGGRGPCSRCAMMYANTAVVSFDPTCPGVFQGDDGVVNLPLDFNVSHCPFCGEQQRTDTPCLFYSPHREQVVYNFPRLGQFSESEARDVHRPMLATLRERLKERLGEHGARRFESAREELTYAMPQFLLAVQMGTIAREEHVCLVVRCQSGDSGLLVDPTKGVLLELTRAELTGYGGMEYITSAAATIAAHDAPAAGMAEAMQAFAAGDFARACEVLAPLLRASPGDSVLRRNLAAALFKLGDREAARRALQGDITWKSTR
jgi:hypothetical protein